MDWSSFRSNLQDVWAFGPQFLARHYSLISGRKIARVRIPSVGPVYVRVGESDVAAFRQVFQDRDYDLGRASPVTERLERRYRKIIDSGKTPVIVDAGANIGAASLWFHNQYPDAAIVAIEPEPGNLVVLHRNLDGRAMVQVLEAAVGAEAGFVAVVNEGSGWSARTVRSDAGVEIVTVEDAIRTVANGVPFIVKIDVEGFERDLFSTNIDWIGEAFAVFIEPHDWMLPGEGTSMNFQKAMGAHDFEMFLSGENLLYVRI